MKAATVHEIKQELAALPAPRLAELILQLAKFKKENKELLSFLLFESADLSAHIANVKKEMDLGFEELPKPNVYLTKKTLRKVLRITTREIRYTGSPQAEVELLTHFCRMVRETRIPLDKSPVLTNMYNNQVKKIRSVIATMHEDLQFEYLRDLKKLE